MICYICEKENGYKALHLCDTCSHEYDTDSIAILSRIKTQTSLKPLLDTLNHEIDARIKEFSDLAIASKSVDHEDRDRYYKPMYTIIQELTDVHWMIFNKYPEFEYLFKALIAQYQGK